MNKEEVINKTADFVKRRFEKESSGHDWWHIYRVWQNAKTIAKNEEPVDLFVVELSALLHDIEDFKFNEGNTSIGAEKASEFLRPLGVDEKTISHVSEIIETLSFKGSGEEKPMKTMEGKIVRDADRMDAIGAIGIARCFTYGGNKGLPIHNPDVKPKRHKTKEEYLKRQTSQINHFYEKLLLLKDLMQTETGKKIAEQRHSFMELYLNQFYQEWNRDSFLKALQRPGNSQNSDR